MNQTGQTNYNRFSRQNQQVKPEPIEEDPGLPVEDEQDNPPAETQKEEPKMEVERVVIVNTVSLQMRETAGGKPLLILHSEDRLRVINEEVDDNGVVWLEVLAERQETVGFVMAKFVKEI